MQFRVIWDQLDACAYREGFRARLPLRMPLRPIPPKSFDLLLQEGDRRSGRMLYRTECPECSACEPLRVPTDRFEPTRNQRRVARQNLDLEVAVGAPVCDAERLNLFNRHRMERGLARQERELPPEHYRAWLVDTCVPSVEVDYRLDGELIAVSVLDVGSASVSAVYHYFNPDHARRSLGVYSVLWELEWARLNAKPWYYLGFYVADCTKLRYKAGYYPHQRRVSGLWWEQAGIDAPLKQVDA